MKLWPDVTVFAVFLVAVLGMAWCAAGIAASLLNALEASL